MSTTLRHVLLALALAVITAPASALAQVMSLQRFEVALWPEFDKPDVLVMYRVKIAAQVPLPVTLRLAIPTAAGMPHAVAKRGPDGTLYLADYVPTIEGDRTWLDITTDSAEVQVEYYTPLVKEGAHRTFSWQWPGGADVLAMAYEVQQPAGALGFQVTPAPTGQTVGSNGLNYATAELGPITASKTASVSLSYDKSVDVLTRDALAVSAAMQQPAEPAILPASTPVPVATTTAPPGGINWWFVAAGVLVVVWLGWTLFRPVRKQDS